MDRALYNVLSAALLAGLALVLFAFYRGARARFAREVERLERQNEIGRVLLTDRNVRGVTRHVAESAARLLGSDSGHVTLATEDAQRLVVEAATGALAGTVGAAVPVEGSMAGWVIRHIQPFVLNDPDTRSPGFRALHEGVPLRRSVMLPLIARGRCVGALGVDNPRDGRAFGPRDVALLRDLADYAALTIEAIQAIEALAERERRSALLNRINSRIRQSLDLAQILDTAVRELGEALQVSRCYVRLRRGGALVETAAAEWFAPGATPAAESEPARAAEIPERAFRERRTVEASDVREPVGTAVAGLAAPLAVLATPIVFRGEIIGVLAFHQAGLPRLWRAADIALVEEIAAELGIAMSNARLYRSVEEASRELAAKISELERANRLKTQFLANMSHELRTPLNSVIGFSEILLATGASLTADQRDGLATISRNGRHLLQLVNDVLDVSKVDAGRMELRLATVDLRGLVTDVLAEIEALVKAKGHRVHLDLADGPLEMIADVTRARQVLFNLLSNAVKFTPPGGDITVQAERRIAPAAADPATDGREVVWLAVTDTGIGIAAADQRLLFSEFTQIDASYARPYEGTGLGLALCRRLMTLHGGRIGVESAKGSGSTFWVEFPVGGPTGGTD